MDENMKNRGRQSPLKSVQDVTDKDYDLRFQQIMTKAGDVRDERGILSSVNGLEAKALPQGTGLCMGPWTREATDL